MRAPLTCCIGLLSHLTTCHIKNRYNNTSTCSVFPHFYEQWVYSLTLVKIKTQALGCCWYFRTQAEVSVPADSASAAGEGLSPVPQAGAARRGRRGGPAPPARGRRGSGASAGKRRRTGRGGSGRPALSGLSAWFFSPFEPAVSSAALESRAGRGVLSGGF